MEKSAHTCDFLIIGGGIIGLSIARDLRQRFRHQKIILIEKEEDCGLHASSRNSGVLHAGFYYASECLKAKFTREGNQVLTDYCRTKKLPINPCGKLVVAREAGDLRSLDELLERGRRNGVPLEEVSEEKARYIEPRAKTFQKAIFSPTTSTVDPLSLVYAIRNDALEEGIQIHVGVRYLKRSRDKVVTSRGDYSAGFVINSAGLYADEVARDFGFSEEYKILPFKGLYLYSDEPKGALRTHVYPVPDLKNPFLGVHFTVMADGRVKIGPTAIPAFWREQYAGFENFKPLEFLDVTLREAGLFLFSGFDFKKLALDEILKYSRSRMVHLASGLVRDVKLSQYRHWGKVGIRAQLVHVKKRTLMMDFLVEGNHKSIHVLNAVSPGFTCAIPFARFVCDKIADA